MILFVGFLLLVFQFSETQDISPIIDVKTLSELPFEQLFQIKSNFITDNDVGGGGGGGVGDIFVDDYLEDANITKTPQALALKQSKIRRGDHHHHHHDYDHDHEYEEIHHIKKGGGKKGIQKLFQISITTLAFLAFGGYLLCLLVQAIRSSQTPTMMMTTMNPTAMEAFFIRRTRRPFKIRKPNRPKRDIWPDDNNNNNNLSDNMYHTLVSLSEAYVIYNTIEYRKFNYTSNY